MEKSQRLAHGNSDTPPDGDAVICEIKPQSFVAEQEERLRAAEAEITKESRFMLVTDKQIDANGQSARAILLMRYGRLHFTPEQAQDCKRQFEQEMAGTGRVAQLIERGVSESLVWHMVARHMLRTTQPLNMTPAEPVEINDPQENCFDHFQRWFTTSGR